MKFTIATIHSAYGLSYIPDGKVIESELSNAKVPVSLADLNWLKPNDEHKYIADMMFANEIIGLDRVENALSSYFTEQFDNDSSRLLWMPKFHQKYLFSQFYLDNKSVFDVKNTIFSKVLTDIATEVEVLVFYLGDKSLAKLGSPKFLSETFLVGDMKVKISAYEITDKSGVYDDMFMNYNLTILNQDKNNFINGLETNDPVLLEQFSEFGKLESI